MLVGVTDGFNACVKLVTKASLPTAKRNYQYDLKSQNRNSVTNKENLSEDLHRQESKMKV